MDTDSSRKRTPVLYVGGMARSGSTLLDLMLGQLDRHVEVGELFYLWQSGVERNFRCACGNHFADCPFWVAVGERAYGGWSNVDHAEVQHLQRRVDATRWLPFIVAPGLKPGFRRDLDRYVAIISALYRAVSEVSGADVVVDSTKRPSLAYILWRAPDIDLRVVHVLRDPRGVVYSWTQAVELPEGTALQKRIQTRSPNLITRRWVTVNAMFAALPVPTAKVRYEDLVRDPGRELAKVAALTTDVTGRPDPLSFLDGNTFTPHGSHTVAGGRIRMRTGPITVELDEKWRRELPPHLRRRVTRFTWPLRARYGY